MLNKVVIGSYYPIKSRIHFMNPVVKIICTILFITITFLCHDIRLMSLLTLVCIFLLEMAYLPRMIYIKTFSGLKYLMLFMIVIYYFMGTNIEVVLNMCLRIYIIVIYTTIITLTTTPNDITYGLKVVLSPLKVLGVPVNKLSFSISLALRFIPTIIEQGNKIMKSQASRGVDYYASNLSGKISAIKSMILPMFILTIKRADSLAEAMEIRLYDINAKRTNFHEKKCSFFDILLLSIHFGILFLLLARMVIY